MLGEGRWERKFDEKGRLPIPFEIRDEFGTTGVWMIEPRTRRVCLYPLRFWEEVSEGVGDPQQFREVRKPHEESLDPQGRMPAPPHIREILEREVVVMSMGKYLKVFNQNGEEQPIGTDTPENLRPFQSFQEAKEYRDQGKKVIYLGHVGGKVTGKFKPEGFFVFSGQDENGVIVPVIGSYDEFYPGE
ncbi:MAG: hypothetical protein E3J36_00690 [Candidatus Nealsonbacteria bacterium]|nr:MAG: hypothetical protein E3J36_00690 [Candidatus Nealsonbacteria bacterium]